MLLTAAVTAPVFLVLLVKTTIGLPWQREPSKPRLVLIKPSRNETISEGMRVVLECLPAKDEMNVYDLQFQRGDLTASANQRTNRLTLETFTEEDNAVYSCVAKSRTRQSENSNAIRLFVDEKPANVPQKPTLKVETWDRCHLECTGSKNETEKLLTFTLIESSVCVLTVRADKEMQTTGSLMVTGAGNYTCTVTTQEGESATSNVVQVPVGVCRAECIKTDAWQTVLIPGLVAVWVSLEFLL